MKTATAHVVSAIACLVIFACTISLMLPLLTLTLEERGTSSLTIGILGALTGGGILISAPLAPLITRRFNVPLTMVFLFTIIAVCFVAYKVWEDSIIVWFVLRAITAVAGGLIFVIAEAAITAAAPVGKRGVVFGIYATGFSIGFAIGPLIIATVGIHGWMPYLLAAVLTLSPSILILTVGIGTLPEEKRQAPSFLNLFRRSPLPFVCAFAVGACETTVYDLLPPYARKLGMDISEAAVLLTVFSAGAVFFHIFLGMLADKVGYRLMIIALAVASFFGALALPWIVTSGMSGWVFLMLWSASILTLYPVGLCEATRFFEAREFISVNALFAFCYGFGALLAPAAAGAVMDIVPHGLGGVLAVVILAVFLFAWRKDSTT